jgi:uncharacterized protein YegL
MIKNSYIQLHKLTQYDETNPETTFGILDIHINKHSPSPIPQNIIFTVDCSGSMSDICKDKRTKMQHIIHSLKNMLYYFSQCDTKIYVQIFAFEKEIYNIIDNILVTKENVATLMQTVEKIIPLSSTNIEKALKNVAKCVEELEKEQETKNENLYPTTHIFMTDGEATAGSFDPNYLQSLVKEHYSNVFIGFGHNHDSIMLNTLASIKNTSYYFIDSLENSGLVYGEVIHNILYKVSENITIQAFNGSIYNWKTNTWDTQLNIDMFVADTIKTYHIKTIQSNEKSFYCIIKSSNNNSVSQSIELIDVLPTLTEELCDLTHYIFRQKTLELLYQARQIPMPQTENNSLLSDIKTTDTSDMRIEIKAQLKQKLKEIKKYMDVHKKTDNVFLKVLCDDIYITYKTLGTQNQHMFSCARQSSQGEQRAYNVTQININGIEQGLTSTSKLLPLTPIPYEPDYEMVNDDNYTLSQCTETPYSTKVCKRIMREISSP